jgi:heavy metal sensor kinase
MFFHSIKFRLTVWYLAVMAILIILFGFLSYFLLANSLYQNLDRNIQVRSAEILSEMSRPIPTTIQTQIGEIFQIYDSQGNTLINITSDLNIDTINILLDKTGPAVGDTIMATTQTTSGQQVRLEVTRILYRTNLRQTVSAILVLGTPTAAVTQAVDSFRGVVIIGGIVIVILAAAGGYFIALKALKPVDDITRSARSIEETDLSKRIKVRSKDELGRLAETLNEMINRMEKAFERQRQFTADASHELRTPLAVIEAESTLALEKSRSPDEYRESLESVTEEVNYMSSILEKLLMLARADAGKEQLNYSRVNLKDLITGIIPDIEMLSRDKGLRFEAKTAADLFVKGDRVKLKQLLLNLLDNAIKYTPQGTITLSLQQQEDQAVIAVADTGIGIDEEHLPRIFERFYRVDKARSRSEHGTGLGLSIAKYIVEAHGGRIEVTSQPGQGSVFTTYLPLDQMPE